jgi:hypothetical protein
LKLRRVGHCDLPLASDGAVVVQVVTRRRSEARPRRRHPKADAGYARPVRLR